ncbi:hypothetical protein MMC17_006781 [Xylographa soralifera]|nr:hypothetical protein [Xylographa soralifera]
MLLYSNSTSTVATLVLLQTLRCQILASPGCGASCIRPSTNDVPQPRGNDQPAAQPGFVHPPAGPASAPTALNPPASTNHPSSQPALPANVPGAPIPPINQGSLVSPAGSRIFAGLFGDAQGIRSNVYHTPAVTTWHRNGHGDSPYSIFCGVQNARVQVALGAATVSVGAILNAYLDIHAAGASTAPFTDLDAIFPFGNGVGDFTAVLEELSTFQGGSHINVPLGESGHIVSQRVAVCATPTMLEDYGIASAYYDVCLRHYLIVAYHPANSAALMLCPSFFRLAVHVQGSQCPTWNRFFQNFHHSYERRTVEYQSYTILRGFIDVKLGIEEEIYVSPSPSVPNWNELLLLPREQKERSSALYQLYVAMFEQECAPSPLPDQDSFHQYLLSLSRYYLGRQTDQGEEVANAGQIAAEEVGEPSDAAGPSNWQVGESSRRAAG